MEIFNTVDVEQINYLKNEKLLCKRFSTYLLPIQIKYYCKAEKLQHTEAQMERKKTRELAKSYPKKATK